MRQFIMTGCAVLALGLAGSAQATQKGVVGAPTAPATTAPKTAPKTAPVVGGVGGAVVSHRYNRHSH